MSETSTADIQVVKDAIGHMPARPFVWPKTWASVKLDTLDKDGKPILLDNGDRAIRWTAAFVLYTPDGKRAGVSLPPMSDLMPLGSKVDEIHAAAVATCHEVLRRIGAQDGGGE